MPPPISGVVFFTFHLKKTRKKYSNKDFYCCFFLMKNLSSLPHVSIIVQEQYIVHNTIVHTVVDALYANICGSHSMQRMTDLWFVVLSFWHGKLILDGYSVKGAHERSNLCYLICLRYLIRSKQSHIVFLCVSKFFE